MRVVVENDEDVRMLEAIRKSLWDRIITLFDSVHIYVSKELYDAQLEDLIIDLGRLGYEYREVYFALADSKGQRRKYDAYINTNQFCLKEDIYRN